MGLVYRRPSGPVCTLPFQKEKIREKFVEALKTEFAGKGLRFSRGTPFLGWDQAQVGDTICLPTLFSDAPNGELSPPFPSPV